MGLTQDKKHDFFPYILVGLMAATLFFLLLLDRRAPIFSTPAGMAPFFFIVVAIALTLILFAMRTPAPTDSIDNGFWLKWHRSGPIGGALTGLIFLAIYWAYDWPAPNRIEISERWVNKMCAVHPPVPDELIIWTTPDPFSLIPGYMLVGMALGTVVGLLFPRWHRFMTRQAQHRPAVKTLSHPYPSGLLFGLVFGALIGAWLCPIIFSVSDGRPFIRVSTSAISVFLAVGFYLLFEVTSYRHHMNRAAYTTLATVLSVGVLLTSLVWFLDAQLGISATAYCFFYDTWNTQSNQLKPGWLPAIAGAVYGAMCGAIIMSVASGYLIIRATVAQAAGGKISSGAHDTKT
ncbi:MAG TPA: hypothetical protein ENI94_01985 [Gammaproteobacteria bacterium]|nr:hypothetical protein [Gammaproteobacteria bacterium]